MNKLIKAPYIRYLISMFVLVFMGLAAEAYAAKRIVFLGGPAGGTFQTVANAVQVYKGIKDNKAFKVKAQSSAGSIENLRKVHFIHGG